MTRCKTVLLLMMFAIAGCGSSIDNKGKSKGASSSPTNNTAPSNNSTVAASCGDGVLNPGELCDPAIAEGAGACPEVCAAPACATAMLVGSASMCTAQCIVEPVACADGDGCCAAGCDSSNDNDCQNQCGDGVVEGPETCDGNCPAQCDDGDACTTDTLVGTAAQCNAQCRFEPVTTCTSNDGCCPPGCTAEVDNDCVPLATCGNGVLDAGELCDGDCPTSCESGDACSTGRPVGSAATCDARCTTTPISACVSGDGCCPSGCTSSTDSDCACVPRTCAQAGAECGTISNGCGSTITCTDTCTSIEACSAQNKCVAEDFIGANCTDYPQCGSSLDAVCILPPVWPGGYCSILCSPGGNTLCPAGSHCVDFDGTNSVCMSNCTNNSQCDSDYTCRQWDGVGPLECVPPAPAPGSGLVGDACDFDTDCESTLYCAQTAGETSFPGGICTQICVILLDQCPEGGVCTLDLVCAAECTSNADCRVGYSCAGFGLPGTSLHCAPS